MELKIQIISKLVRRLRIEVLPQGMIRVVKPVFCSQKKALQLVKEKYRWIQKKILLAQKMNDFPFSFDGKEHALQLDPTMKGGAVTFGPGIVRIGADSRKAGEECFSIFVDHEARRVLPSELQELSDETELRFSRMSFRNQRTRWGSCSRKGSISLNINLMRLSYPLRRYVMIHELCHLKELNHSKRFWELVSSFVPDYRNIRKELWSHQFFLHSPNRKPRGKLSIDSFPLPTFD